MNSSDKKEVEAGHLNCPMCGASVKNDAPNCSHCGTRLAAVSCPNCFAMMFEGSKFCPHCGVRAERKAGVETGMACPKCKASTLAEVFLGNTPVTECSGCHGLWVEASTFDAICTDRERQSVVLGSASEMYRVGQRALELKVQYVRCPLCRELMQRVNFARCSGIIVDVCKGHGTWFDRDELQHIVEFIRTGGLDVARAKEKAELDAARRRLEAARSAPRRDRPVETSRGEWQFGESDLFDVAGSLLEHLFRKD